MKHLFICYAHEDEVVVKAFERQLNVALVGKGAEVWRDGKIEASDTWRKLILSKIETAAGYVVFVSPAMLASKFIVEEEIPRILRGRIVDGKKLYVVFARSSVVDDREFVHPTEPDKTVKLTEFQGLNDPATPLGALSSSDLDLALANAAKVVSSGFKNAKDTGPNAAETPVAASTAGSGVLSALNIRNALEAIARDKSEFDISLDWRDLTRARTAKLFPQPEGLVKALADRISNTQMSGVIGPPASGKSTLLKQVAYEFLRHNPAVDGVYIDFADAVGLSRNAFSSFADTIVKGSTSEVVFFFDNVHYVLNEASELSDALLRFTKARVFFSCSDNLPKYYIMLGESMMLDELDSRRNVYSIDLVQTANSIVRGVAQAFRVDIDRLDAPASILGRFGGNLHSVAYSVRAAVSQMLSEGSPIAGSVAFGPMIDRLVALSDAHGAEIVLALYALAVWSRYDVALDTDYLTGDVGEPLRKLNTSPSQIAALNAEGFTRRLGRLTRIQNRGLALALYGSISESDILKARMQPLLVDRKLSGAALELEVVRSYLEFRPSNMYILSKQVCNEDGVLSAIARSDSTVEAIVDMILAQPNVFDMSEMLVSFEWKNHNLSKKLMSSLVSRKTSIVAHLEDCDSILSVAHFLAPLWYVSSDAEIKAGKSLVFQPVASDPQRRTTLSAIECPFMAPFDGVAQYRQDTVTKIQTAMPYYSASGDIELLTTTSSCIKAFHPRYSGSIRCAKSAVADVHPGRELFAALSDDAIVRLVSTEKQARQLQYGLSVFRYLDNARTKRLVKRIDPSVFRNALESVSVDEIAAFTVLCLDLGVIDDTVLGQIDDASQRKLAQEWADIIANRRPDA